MLSQLWWVLAVARPSQACVAQLLLFSTQKLDWAFGFNSEIKEGAHTLADAERDVRGLAFRSLIAQVPEPRPLPFALPLRSCSST